MANTYTQIYIHIVFSVSNRTHLIDTENKSEIEKYIAGHLKNKKHKLLAINCMPDHIHIFIGLNPDISISNLVRELKISSANFINDKKFIKGIFSWQTGYGAFSYSRSSIDNVIKYVQDQEKHHKKKSFQEEYLNFLEKFNIPYDKKYVFNAD
jgi:putative transposase